jgi:hypothetical protein
MNPDWREKSLLTDDNNGLRALGRTGGPAKAGCCPTTARRALVAGSPRPAAETGRTADPSLSLNEGEGNAQFF